MIQAVLGEGIARELGHDYGKPSLEPGDVFDLGPRRWVVVGVLRSSGSIQTESASSPLCASASATRSTFVEKAKR